jgi:hypothetical protein
LNLDIYTSCFFAISVAADANFYSMNLLMIGKTYVRMSQKDKAIPYLQRARDFVAKTPDDKQVVVWRDLSYTLFNELHVLHAHMQTLVSCLYVGAFDLEISCVHI